MRAWLHDEANPHYVIPVDGIARLSRHARLWEVETHVLGPACHVLYRYSTGEACGLNLVTRNSFALNTAFVAPRFEAATGLRPRRVLLEANMGGDKKPSAPYFVDGGHGKTVLAEVSVPERTLKSILRSSSADLVALEHLGLHGSHASQMQSVAFTPASIVAAMFAATGQDLGMVGTSSMAHVVLEPRSRVPVFEEQAGGGANLRSIANDRLAGAVDPPPAELELAGSQAEERGPTAEQRRRESRSTTRQPGGDRGTPLSSSSPSSSSTVPDGLRKNRQRVGTNVSRTTLSSDLGLQKRLTRAGCTCRFGSRGSRSGRSAGERACRTRGRSCHCSGVRVLGARSDWRRSSRRRRCVWN